MARCHWRNTVQSFLRCSECGHVLPINRKRGRRHPSGHIKTMWCFRCRKKTDHIEALREYEISMNM